LHEPAAARERSGHLHWSAADVGVARLPAVPVRRALEARGATAVGGASDLSTAQVRIVASGEKAERNRGEKGPVHRAVSSLRAVAAASIGVRPAALHNRPAAPNPIADDASMTRESV
jgi:hypothetical protein